MNVTSARIELGKPVALVESLPRENNEKSFQLVTNANRSDCFLFSALREKKVLNNV